MRRRSNRARRFDEHREATEARESLERRWAERRSIEPRLATLVTADGARREPIHRWHPYRQGFSPGLVRLFLDEHPRVRRDPGGSSVLDPFSGSGTCVVECARRGVRAIGVEAMESLAFLSEAKFTRGWSPMPELPDASNWESIAECLTEPIHRAALMLAEGRRHTADGRLNRGARSIGETLAEVCEMIRDDLDHPLSVANRVLVGDARRIEEVESESVAGLLTSPPYLSRYDYAAIVDPIERVYRFWCGRGEGESAGDRAMRATVGSRGSAGGPSLPRPWAKTQGKQGNDDGSVVREVEAALERGDRAKSARAASDYFRDMALVLGECHRVLRTGGVAWLVVGGARIGDVYVPSDLIVAEQAERAGFVVSSVRVARELTPTRRKFGGFGHVAPRESVIEMHKP